MRRFAFAITCACAVIVASPARSEDDGPVRYDVVSDTVGSIWDKANALMTGQLEITMTDNKRERPDDFTRDAIGRKVPKATAVKSAGSLHNDQPL